MGSQWGLIWEMALIMWPLESMHTAAWAEKLSLMAVSKLISKEPASREYHTSVSSVRDFQAATCSKTFS